MRGWRADAPAASPGESRMPSHTARRTARRGTSTYPRIWAVVRRIPRGRVATYGQIAALAGFPSQPRLAGYALHALPEQSAVPWHRVINARGRISLPPTDGLRDLQRAMLEAEGVVFRGGRIDLGRHGWKTLRRRGASRVR